MYLGWSPVLPVRLSSVSHYYLVLMGVAGLCAHAHLVRMTNCCANTPLLYFSLSYQPPCLPEILELTLLAIAVSPTPSLHHPLLEPLTERPLQLRDWAYLSRLMTQLTVQVFAPNLVSFQMCNTCYKCLQCLVVQRVQPSVRASPLFQMVSLIN